MKKILASALTAILCIGFCFYDTIDTTAKEEIKCIEGSYLTYGEESEGSAISKTKGIYLGSGTSKIKKTGEGQIAAGGNTCGQTTIDKISITVEVQKLVNGKWQTYTTWSVTEYGVPIVTTSKVLNVPKGYYYRVYCTHHANSDVSGSFTNGIYI